MVQYAQASQDDSLDSTSPPPPPPPPPRGDPKLQVALFIGAVSAVFTAIIGFLCFFLIPFLPLLEPFDFCEEIFYFGFALVAKFAEDAFGMLSAA